MARKAKTKKETPTLPPVKLSWFKRTFNSVKGWILGNGIEGILGLVLGLLLWSFGYKIYEGFALGVFATRNWDLVKAWVSKLLSK